MKTKFIKKDGKRKEVLCHSLARTFEGLKSGLCIGFYSECYGSYQYAFVYDMVNDKVLHKECDLYLKDVTKETNDGIKFINIAKNF